MNSNALCARSRPWLLLALLMLVAGCATQRIDWTARVGIYTYDQAILDLGPPDKWAKLQDGTIVAEWLTDRGYAYVGSVWYGYGYPYWPYYPYAGFYPGFTEYYSPNYFLRLIFDPEGKLKAWKKFAR